MYPVTHSSILATGLSSNCCNLQHFVKKAMKASQRKGKDKDPIKNADPQQSLSQVRKLLRKFGNIHMNLPNSQHLGIRNILSDRCASNSFLVPVPNPTAERQG